jgi:hypothetical protein
VHKALLVQLEVLAQLVLQAQLGQLVRLDHRALLDLQERIHLLQGLPVQPDNKALQAQLDHRALLAQQVGRVSLALLVLLVLPVQQGKLDQQDRRVPLGLQVLKVRKGSRAQRVLQDHKVLQERLGQQEPKEFKDQQDQPVHKEIKEL